MKALDSDHTLFGSRIIARNDLPDNRVNQTEDNFMKDSKDIRFVLPGFDTMGIAVDDCAAVWKDQSNVITVPKFLFWDRFSRCLDQITSVKLGEEERRKHSWIECVGSQIVFDEVGPIVNANDLGIIRDALLAIHHAFYDAVKKGSETTLKSTSETTLKSTSETTLKSTPEKLPVSTSEVIRQIRSRVLANRVVFFDGCLHSDVCLGERADG